METSCLTVGSTRCMPCMYCRRHTRCKGNFELSKGKKCKGKNLTEFERHLLKVHLGKTDKFLKTLRKKFEKDLKARTKHIDMLLKLHHNSNIEKSPRFPEVIKQTHTSEVHTIQTSTSEVHTVPTQLYTTPSQSYTTTQGCTPPIELDPTPHNQTVHYISELVVQGTPYNTYIKNNTQFFDFRNTPVNHSCNNEPVLDSTEPLPDLKDIVSCLEVGESRKGKERKRAKKEPIDEGYEQIEQLGVTRGRNEKVSVQLGGMEFKSEKVESVTEFTNSEVITPQDSTMVCELNTPNNSPLRSSEHGPPVYHATTLS